MKNWEKKKLGELNKKKDAVVSGPFGSNLKVSDYKTEGIPILRLQNIGKGFFIDKDIKYISKEKAEELKYHSFISGDIALAKLGAPIGKTCIIPSHFKSGIITADIVRIRPDKNLVDYNFLEYFLNSDLSVSQLAKNICGSTRPRVNLSDVRDIEILLPPLAEQKHIVSTLDKAFAAIGKAKANAELILKNAKELFESYLQKMFEKKSKGWECKQLGEIADVEYGYTDKSTEKGDFRYIRITDIDKNGELILSDKKYIKYSKEAANFLISKKDLLMARTGATFAKVLLFNGDEPSVFASYLIRIKFKVNIENEIYWYFTKTQNYWEQAISLQSGSAQPHFNGAAVKQVVFSYPVSTKLQKELIEKFRNLQTEIKRLEIIYQKKIGHLEDLKQSILQKAFTGELTKAEIVL